MITPEQKQQIESYLKSTNYVAPEKLVDSTQPTGSSWYDDVQKKSQELMTSTVTKAPLKKRVADVLVQGTEKYTQAKERYQKGEQSAIETKAQQFARGLSTAGGVAVETLRSIPFIGSALDKVTGDISKNIAEGKGALGEFLQSDYGKKAIEEYQNLSPRTKENINALFEIGTALIGGGTAKPITRIATEELASPLVKTIGKTISASGRVLEQGGKTALESAITPTVREAERILKYKAETPFLTRVIGEAEQPLTRGITALERGISGTEEMIGIKSKRVADSIWKDTIAPAVKNSPKIVTKEDLFSPIEELISNTTEPGRRQSFIDAYEALKNDYKSFPEIISLEDAQKLKSELDTFTPSKLFNGKEVANEYSTLKNEIADNIRKITYDTLDDINIKKAYLDYSNLTELQKIGVNAISEAGFKGGSGKLVSTLWDKATVPIKTVGGQVLYRVGKIFEFIGDKGVKKFGEFLESKGYNKPIEMPPEKL